MIPAEAVEAAAKVLYLEDHLWDEPWEAATMAAKYRTNATLALEAAAPHMQGCDDELWREFQAATATAGTNPSVVIRRLIREWVNNRKADDD